MKFKNKAALEIAIRNLKIASAIIHGQASGTEPFRASKFLNVLGKEAGQLTYELGLLLGSRKWINPEELDVPKQPSLQILKAMKEDKELEETV